MENQSVRVIKRYGNRKLYDTKTSQYVTLDEIAQMIRAGEDVSIIDNQTKEDLTGITLTQIILEDEKRKKGAMPLAVLRNMIQTSGDQINEFLRAHVTRPVTGMREEAERSIDELRKRSEQTTTHITQNIRDAVTNTQKTLEDLNRRIIERKEHTVENPEREEEEMKGFSREIAKLRAQLDTFEKRVKTIRLKAKKDGEPEGSAGSPQV